MSAADITTVPLTVEEEHTLTALEGIVAAGLDSFIAVGNALAEIHNRKLYRATHATFEDYARDRFGISRFHAYRQIEAARIANVVLPIGNIERESQARELTGLNDDQVRAVWEKATEASEKPPTANVIREARQSLLPNLRTTRRRRPLPDAFRDSVWGLQKTTKTLVNLATDDRWHDNTENIPRGVRNDLRKMIAALTEVLNSLDNGGDVDPDIIATGKPSPIVIEVGPNTATVICTELWKHRIRHDLTALDVRWQVDRKTRRILFPAKRAADLQAMIESGPGTVTAEIRQVIG